MSPLPLSTLAILAALSLPEAPPPPDVPPAPVSSGDRRQGPFSRDTYPSEVIARPLALPAGMFRADASLDVPWLRLGGTTTWSSDAALAASYGLTDRFELTASAGLALSPLLASRRLALTGTFLAVDGKELDLAVQVGADVLPSVLPSPGLRLGMPLRVLLSDQVFLRAGADVLRVQVYPFLISPALKVGLGAQIGGSVAVTLDTDLVRLAFRALPVDLGVTVAVSRSFDLRLRARTTTVLSPRLDGGFTLAGSAYF